ncbi:MAG: RNA polymerase sigma factor FliA [Gallionella sp.]
MYTSAGISDKDQCLREHAHLVKRIAHQMMAKLPYSVQIDDIIQAGMMGLLDAATRFDELHGAQFETYATQRIRGAMLDELRAADWLPRSLRRDMRRIETAISQLQQKLGKPPVESEIAEQLEIPLAEYQHMLQESRGAQLLYYEDFNNDDQDDFFEHFESDKNADPMQLLQDGRFRQELVKAIEVLPERERMVMGMIYEQDMNLSEIGAVMGVGESRISQLHSQAVARLRGKLRGY